MEVQKQKLHSVHKDIRLKFHLFIRSDALSVTITQHAVVVIVCTMC